MPKLASQLQHGALCGLSSSAAKALSRRTRNQSVRCLQQSRMLNAAILQALAVNVRIHQPSLLFLASFFCNVELNRTQLENEILFHEALLTAQRDSLSRPRLSSTSQKPSSNPKPQTPQPIQGSVVCLWPPLDDYQCSSTLCITGTGSPQIRSCFETL